MKRYFILLFFFVTLCGYTQASAQSRNDVEAAKVAFITDKVGLTADQAQKFWPVYNEYEAKRRDLVKNYRSGYRNNLDEVSEQESRARIEEMFETKEKELALEKEYAARYQRIISTKQLIMLYRAEREFTKLLLKKLDNRKVQNQ